MHNILDQTSLLKLAAFQNQWIILCIVVGAIAILVSFLAVRMLKRRRSKKGINVNSAYTQQLSSKKPEESYEFIAEQIKRVEKKYKSILFASIGLGSLPVTIPVNVAIRLAKDKRRCILIDLDIRRDAVAKVFELDGNQSSLSGKAIRTEFENLWVLPGHNFTQLKQMNVGAIVEKAMDRFDFILINAPSLTSSPDRRQIVSAGQAAFICTKSASEATKLAELMKSLNCAVIGHIQITRQTNERSAEQKATDSVN
jgi:Mrp family chromosome partitioning ATPase